MSQSNLYRLKEDDERFGLKAGDILLCEPYWLDPHDKLTVIKRIFDGYDPECNVYRECVDVVNLTDPPTHSRSTPPPAEPQEQR